MHLALCASVERGGGVVATSPTTATGLIWADPSAASAFESIVSQMPMLEWVQLPYAGIEPFLEHISDRYLWTCGKGVYAEPVAEHALGLALAGLRHIAAYHAAGSWTGPFGANLLGSRVTIIGAGGIATSLIRLLKPFGVTVTVVRRRAEPMTGVDRVLDTSMIHEAVSDARVVFVAAALTDETRHLIDAATLAAMGGDTWIVNVARGAIIDTEALADALERSTIAGAALDVTEPEPLPDGHRLWSLDNAIITPHVANTPEMGIELLANRVETNVALWLNGDPLIGTVDIEARY
jgi:phosphoglycerate dehydrogenase-like enzyme